MARRLTVTDGYALINALAAEMMGNNATVQAVDLSTFASVGESILQHSTEDIINTLSLICSRDLIAVRPYKAKLRIMDALDSGVFSNRIRKISYYSRYAEATGASNTQLYTNLAMGFDNGTNPSGGIDQSTGSQWEQHAPVVWEFNFGGGVEWQYAYTLYDDQLKMAFRSPEAWADFLNGFLVQCNNDIQQEKEAFKRGLLLNAIAGVFNLTADMPDSLINMTTVCNTEWGTSYTTQQILEGHFAEMLTVFVETVKTTIDNLSERSILYHWSPTKSVNGVSYYLPRQTEKSDIRMIMLSKFWNRAEATVMPAIFNPNYLTDPVKQFEKLTFWQNIQDPYAIDITPAIPDTTTPSAQIAGSRVQQSVILGVMYDKDAMMSDFQLERADSTVLEAKKHYRNIWNTIRKNPIWDATENFVVFYMAD